MVQQPANQQVCESDRDNDRRDGAVDGPMRLCVQLGMTCKEIRTNVDIASRNTVRNITEWKLSLCGFNCLRHRTVYTLDCRSV